MYPLKSKTNKASFLGALLLGALLQSSLGCATTGSTRMQRGETFLTGEAAYDDFFREVHDAQEKAGTAEGDSSLKKTLAAGLGVKVTSSDELFAAAKSKADALKSTGGGLYLQLVPEPKLYNKKPLKKEEDSFSKAVVDTVRQGVARSDEFAGLGQQMQKLELKIDDLVTEAGSTFKDEGKKEDVRKELNAARTVLEDAQLKAFAESGRSLSFVVAVARAVNTGNADAIAMNDAPPAVDKQKPVAKFTGKVPKAKPKADFDP